MAADDDDELGGWHNRSRPLEPDENATVRKILKKLPPEKAVELLDMLEEFNRYRWLWGLLGNTGGWVAATIVALWALRDQIAKAWRAIFPGSP